MADAVTAAVSGAESATERAEWLEALERTRASWRAAFEARPATVTERRLGLIATDPERVVPVGRECERCDAAIPAGKRPTALYCGDDCRRSAHAERAAA